MDTEWSVPRPALTKGYCSSLCTSLLPIKHSVSVGNKWLLQLSQWMNEQKKHMSECPMAGHCDAAITLKTRPPSSQLRFNPTMSATIAGNLHCKTWWCCSKSLKHKKKTKLTWVHTLTPPQVPRCGSGEESDVEAWVPQVWVHPQVTWTCFWSGTRKLGASLTELSIRDLTYRWSFPSRTACTSGS